MGDEALTGPAGAPGAEPPNEKAPDSTEAIAAAIKRNQRRGLLLALGVLVLSGGAGFLFWFTQRSLLPKPDDRALETVREGLASFDRIPKDMRFMAAAETLADFESERLPKRTREMLNDVSYARWGGGTMRSVGEPIAEGKLKDELTRVCERGPKVLAELAELKRLERGRYFYDKCDLARFDLLTADEAGRADAGLLVLAYLILDYLQQNRALLPEEVALLRHLTADTALVLSAPPSRGYGFQ